LTVEPDTERLLVEAAEYIRNRYFGKYRGLVNAVEDVDSPDTQNLGRIRARVPEVYGDMISPWALPAVPFAGDGHGLVALPEVNDGVWIEFEAGDISRPVWSGCWWASGQLPAPGARAVRTLVTSGGHRVVLDDEAKKLQLLHSGGAELTMTDNDITLKIGSSQIVLSASGVSVNDGALEVT
jgi:uncharacterized protein involved in type VI secretion and phage assembly